jgi:two-component system sensor histidine kinase MtrB
LADGTPSPRRLVLVVVAIATVAAAGLALVVYVLVRDARLRDSVERAHTDAEFNLLLAGPLLVETTDLQQAIESYEERGIHAILFVDGDTYRSDPSFEISVPEGLRALVAEGQLGFERVEIDGVPTLLVGGPTPDRDAELYFAFSEAAIRDDLAQLSTALLIGGLALVVVAFAMARVAAGRIATLAEAEAWGRRFTSNVSHELRTPVAALVSEAEVLEGHLDGMPPEARRAAELLVGDVARLRELVEDLTDLASLDAGREQIRAESFDLAALVAGTVRSRGWDGRVELRLATDRVPVVSDRNRVDRIVANLIGNALDHGQPPVEVRIARDGSRAVVEVVDAGPGIAKEHLDHVFDRFYRADPARSGPGSGLGLAIARENARLLGGDVEVSVETGAGTRFRVTVPLIAVAEP